MSGDCVRPGHRIIVDEYQELTRGGLCTTIPCISRTAVPLYQNGYGYASRIGQLPNKRFR
jgi:hypothetical protein